MIPCLRRRLQCFFSPLICISRLSPCTFSWICLSVEVGFVNCALPSLYLDDWRAYSECMMTG